MARLSVRARALLKRAALTVSSRRREHGDPAYSTRDFLAEVLAEVLGARDCAVIMARLQPVGIMNRVQSLCQIEHCGKLSVLGTLFCFGHRLEAATLDEQLSRIEGPILRCAFKGRNPDGTNGCSLYFRSLTTDLCHYHRSGHKPPSNRLCRVGHPTEGATIHALPLTRAPKRSSKKGSTT